MTTAETLSLMIEFGIFVITLLSFIFMVVFAIFNVLKK